MSSLKSYAGSSAYRDMLNTYDHILDPNERRRLLLAEIDKSPFGWYHVRAVVVAGAGFFTDAYDVCVMSLAAYQGTRADSDVSRSSLSTSPRQCSA
jgi:PHS family inorganic phosphate transporter-like MFS transporter